MAASLAGKRLVITSGPTRANLDAVRFISNRSTGRLGARIAVEALDRGAQVALVAGPESIVPAQSDLPADAWDRLRILPIEAVADLMETLQRELTGDAPPDAVVHAMAVLDYVPESASDEKTPSGRNGWEIRLVKAPKVIRSIKEWAPKAFLVQFKLEIAKSDERLREIALASLMANHADLVVANDLQRIRDEEHPALIIAPDGTVLARPGTKTEIAAQLCDILAQKLAPA